MRGSVRARLALWHTLAVAAILAAFALGTYVFLVRSAGQRIDQSLADIARNFSAAWVDELAETPTATPSHAALEALVEFRYRDRRLLVYDSTGTLVAASDSSLLHPELSPEVLRTLHRSPLASLARDAAAGIPARATLGTNNAWLRAMAMAVEIGGQSFTVVALRSEKSEEEVYEAYAGALLVAIPLALALAGLGGYLLARASLAPVAQIAAAAERIGERNLDQRLSVANPHDELGRLAAVLNGLLGRLQRAFEQQRQFMADASHELRTPVTAFRSAADIALARAARPEEEYRDTLRVISSEGRRLSRIVDDLFLLARADAGQQPVRKERLFLEEVLADCARSARALGAVRRVRVEFLPADEAPLEGDAALLERLVINLLDNAVRHSPADGLVQLTLSRDLPGAPADPAAAGTYRIEVRDSGPGIPVEARAHIFERFYRADAARRRDSTTAGEGATHPTGAGLGLAIALWVAEMHGGSVTFEAPDLGGALFVVRLPVARTSHGVPAVAS